jgi:hypothetical protein
MSPSRSQQAGSSNLNQSRVSSTHTALQNHTLAVGTVIQYVYTTRMASKSQALPFPLIRTVSGPLVISGSIVASSCIINTWNKQLFLRSGERVAVCGTYGLTLPCDQIRDAIIRITRSYHANEICERRPTSAPKAISADPSTNQILVSLSFGDDFLLCNACGHPTQLGRATDNHDQLTLVFASRRLISAYCFHVFRGRTVSGSSYPLSSIGQTEPLP